MSRPSPTPTTNVLPDDAARITGGADVVKWRVKALVRFWPMWEPCGIYCGTPRLTTRLQRLLHQARAKARETRAMTDEEWDQTGPGQALDAFESVVLSLGIVTAGGTLGGAVLSWMARAVQDSLTPRRARQLNAARDATVTTAMGVMSTWSAFEAWAQDFTKGLMREDPHVLEQQAVQDRKYTMSDLLAPEEDRIDTVYRALNASLGRKRGVDRFEDLFRIFNLSAGVPKVIKDKFYAAQMVRHVWAHNAGIADAAFTRKARQLGYEEGDLVTVSLEQLSEYMAAVITYAMIVSNRHRACHDLGPLPMEEKPSQTPIGLAYHGLYANSASQTTSH